MAGAYAGGLLARFIPGHGAADRLRRDDDRHRYRHAARTQGRRLAPKARIACRSPKILAEGLVVGLVTGLVGAGGGFLVVPALALLGGLPMPIAVGTSLIVIAMKSFAGLGRATSPACRSTGRWPLPSPPPPWSAPWSAARLTAMVNPDALRKGFGWFVLAMSSVILAQEIHPSSRYRRWRP